MGAVGDTLLRLRDLTVDFDSQEGKVHAVNHVSFDVAPGELVGLVGESGCGKSVTASAIIGLTGMLPNATISGSILFRNPLPLGAYVASVAGDATKAKTLVEGGKVLVNGAAQSRQDHVLQPGDTVGIDGQPADFVGPDLLKLPEADVRKVRGKDIAMIFQDPVTSLNPVLSIERLMTEGLELHLGLSHADAVKRSIDLLGEVGIPKAANRIKDYPHQFSGGMRQRVMIAIALSCNPKLLLADEPTTALDVTIQAQILRLLKKLSREHEAAVIVITHDLGVVAGMCRRILVMYAGRIVESGPAKLLFGAPHHPYTVGLLKSVPRLNEPRRETLQTISGLPPDLAHLPPGCSFAPRCFLATDECWAAEPQLEPTDDGRLSACFHRDQLRASATTEAAV